MFIPYPCGWWARVSQSADFIVTVGDVSISPGSTGYVPVYISSDTGQTLNSTNFEFRITTGGPGRLEFSDSPSPASDPTFSDLSYAFFGNSLDQTYDLPLGAASLTIVPGDTFVGGDATLDFTDVIVSGDNLLLVDLPITTVTDLPPVAGDTFSISLVSTAGNSFAATPALRIAATSFLPIPALPAR